MTLGEETSEATVKINIHKNAYASRVIDFLPAPGQFTNQLSKSNSAEGTLGTKGGTLSLGSFGGYVIYGFDQPILRIGHHTQLRRQLSDRLMMITIDRNHRLTEQSM